MVKIGLQYTGDLQVEAVHESSGVVLKTDPPVDNQGQGRSFSPTDLVATALGTCMMTIMAMAARRHGLELKGTTVEVQKLMSQAPVRRIGELKLVFRIPCDVAVEQRKVLEQAALTCPVALSIHPDIQVDTQFLWGVLP